MSDTTVNKISAGYIASEIWDVSICFKVLVAQKIESELTEAVKHAETLDDVTNGRTPKPS